MNGNPLVLEYHRRLSRHRSVERDVQLLLAACIHEAGHLVGYTSFGLPVVTAMVDRRARHMGYGLVVPSNFLMLRSLADHYRADYVCTSAGPHAEFLMTGSSETDEGGAGDRQDAQAILDKVHALNPAVRYNTEAVWDSRVDNLVRRHWQFVEAFAFELMRTGKFEWGAFKKIECRYGMGHWARNLSSARRTSARNRLAAFHASPEELRRALQLTASPQPDMLEVA